VYANPFLQSDGAVNVDFDCTRLRHVTDLACVDGRCVFGCAEGWSKATAGGQRDAEGCVRTLARDIRGGRSDDLGGPPPPPPNVEGPPVKKMMKREKTSSSSLAGNASLS
jgi:hypothetical protein